MHLQEGPFAVVIGGRIRSLLLVVHAKGVPDLVDHVAQVVGRVAPSQVDKRKAIAHAVVEAALLHPIADDDADGVRIQRRRRLLLLEADARVVCPNPDRLPEDLLPIVVHIVCEPVHDPHILAPLGRHPRHWAGLAPLPWPTAGAAVGGPAVPVPAGPTLRRLLLQRGALHHFVLRNAVLLLELSDVLPGHNAVSVLNLALQNVPIGFGDAVILVVADVAEDLERAVRGGRQSLGPEEEAGLWRLLMPDLPVQHRRTASADPSLFDAEDVHGLADAEAGACLCGHRRPLEPVEGQAARARFWLGPP
mmetsp:Transcript_69696/g.217557  ORF Transcript_69696/g.217557 Transcript_69696/m.217557 type:complete len:306 (-) Transcript_69696:114-1031(-)